MSIEVHTRLIRNVIEKARKDFDKELLSIAQMQSLYINVCGIINILEAKKEDEENENLLKMAYALGSDLFFTVAIHERQNEE